MPDGMTGEVRAALDQCRAIITKGSKSFSLAARLFDPATRDAAFFLYGWCRYCDDQVDRAAPSETPQELARRLKALKERTAAAFTFAPQREPVFIALQHIVHRYAIPSHYALELIEGMAMDAGGVRYATLKELLLYCYRVAGTVGLMMSHVMGLRDEGALRHAADLGIAMQLTNIARDIIEDAAMGRTYLPAAWLKEAEIAPGEIAAPNNREKLAMLTLRLLREAERYYRSGDEGLWHLSFRSACAVTAARHVYSEIGRLLLRRGARAWDQRTYVTGARKLCVVLRALCGLLRSVPARLLQPWSPAPLRMIWKASNIQ
ncbi:MAG TPA: phytoene/squalene synthase family protein [Terriglobales bacterium]|jgi:phytoene synthase|nr:phytoene/squalene synthase family protein [Terriglobales bacterium]